MTENTSPAELNCYLNGIQLGTGTTDVKYIATDVRNFNEITFGTSISLLSSESIWVGFVKEFRWWNIVRTNFEILNFMNVAISNI